MLLRQLTLSKTERQAIECFATEVRNKLGDQLVRMFLFGSKTRGDSHPESDIDILIIVQQRTGERDRIIRDAAFDISLVYDVVLSPVIYEKDEYNSSLHRATVFYQNVEKQGIAL